MAKFTVRIELHGGKVADYERLDPSMKAEGFEREILSGDGMRYVLPQAEYVYEGDASLKDMLAKVKIAGEASGLRFSALVTESKGRVWYGLKKIS